MGMMIDWSTVTSHQQYFSYIHDEHTFTNHILHR